MYLARYMYFTTFAALDFERKEYTFGAHMETVEARSEGIRRLHTGASPPSFVIADETSGI